MASTIDLLVDNITPWASNGAIEEVTEEKRKIGWTGSSSDYAYNVWINSIWNQQDKRTNTVASALNKLLQNGVATYNALYEYSVGSLCEFNGRLYIAKIATAGTPPPSGYNSNDNWDLVVPKEYLLEELEKIATLESPALTGTPTAPTADGTNDQQIANVDYVAQKIAEIATGASVLDLSLLSSAMAYPVLLAKNNLTTNCVISRDAGFGSSNQGFMRLAIEGIGQGLSGILPAFLNIVHLTDSTSGCSVTTFVKKIQCKSNNSVIAVWLRGGTKYNIFQYNVESKPEIVESATTLENSWVVAAETWDASSSVATGSWSVTAQSDYTIDGDTLSDTGTTSLLGGIIYVTGTTNPQGTLIANGAAVSRTTYSALFNYIGVRYGVGDGTTTFNLPDLRGIFPRGIDLGRGYDCGEWVTACYGGGNDRTTTEGIGSYQQDAIRNITASWSFARCGFYNSDTRDTSAVYWNTTSTGAYSQGGATLLQGAGNFQFGSNVRVTDNSTGENIVKNMALLPCIYYI